MGQNPFRVIVTSNVSPASGKFVHIAANANNDAIKSGAGSLLAVVINTKGATGNILTLYDSLTHGTGTTIAIIDTTAGPSYFQYGPYGLAFATGLSSSLATGTAADVTIIYS